MRYLPHSSSDIEAMCQAIGIELPSDLFGVIPESLRLKEDLKLDPTLNEPELVKNLSSLANKNTSLSQLIAFIGAGSYHHYIPAVISQLLNRGEFLTAYTPYQAEVAQGTLQYLFEFQSMIASLTGMEIANASLYDGASSLAEAMLMALRLKRGRSKILVAGSIHPESLEVCQSYLKYQEVEIVEIGYDASGRVDAKKLTEQLDSKVAAVCIQSPNFFGVIEDQKKLIEQTHESGALYISSFTEALSLAMLEPAGSLNADIVVGEGQSFGIPVNYGGPYLGLFATQQKYIRQMPGRIVGQTEDSETKPGYVLTFSTREQHIRREKATSNICTNQGLCALAATIYLSLMGPQGLKKVAQQNHQNSEYLKSELTQIKGISLKFSGSTFNEFVIESDSDSDRIEFKTLREALKNKGFVFGLDLERFSQNFKNCLLLTATEMQSFEEIDKLVAALKEILIKKMN